MEQGTRRAAQLFVALSGLVALFQLALVFGAPWGHLTWGGRYAGVLPPAMRGVAGISLFLVAGFAWVIAARAGLLPKGQGPWGRRAAWGVVGYSALGVVANAATPSPWERIVWLPVVSVMLVTSVWVARSSVGTRR